MRKKFSVEFFVISIFMSCLINAAEPRRQENFLIPRKLIPLEYTLLFDIDMADKTNLFTGIATIKIQCVQSTNEIILNVKDLQINKDDVEVTKESVRKSRSCLGKILLPLRCIIPKKGSTSKIITLDIEGQDAEEERERFKIILRNKLQKDEVVTVLIKYRKLSSLQHPDMTFIKYSYKRDSDDEEKWFAVSRSGAIHGRRLYPCVDERDLRTPITVIISHHRKFQSVSNTDIGVDAESIAMKLMDFVVEKYTPTNSMSTFSMGIVVGNLRLNNVADSLSLNDVRIWADESIIDQTTYAKNAASAIIKFYRTYFNSKHTGHKIDIVALPRYGYTDKWMLDLITLDESVITNLNPREEIRKIEIAFHLCDIFSHQYFGPLTTNSKWGGNWLNMGLALIFRAPCFDYIFPAERNSLMIIDETESFIRISDVDPGRVFHPLTLYDSQINLNTLFEDSALADIAYYLVRMLNTIVSKTDDVLYEGVKKYIADSRDKVFKLNEIWRLFQRDPDNYYIPRPETLLTVMDTWTSTSAIPIIKLSRTADGNEMVSITQEPLETDDSGDKIYKYVPVNYATKSELLDPNYERHVRLWLNDQPDRMEFLQTEDWIIHDSRLDVLCRYVYNQSILILIKETLSSESQYTTIPDLARAQLISDMFAIAEMKEYPDYTYSMVFRILTYLKHERSLPPLMVALHEFNKIRLRLLGSKAFPFFQDYVQQILQKIFDENQYENISQFEQNDYAEYYLKKLIVTSSCTFQVKPCVDQSIELFNLWHEIESEGIRSKGESGRSPFPEIIRQYIYCQAIRKGGEEKWKFLWSFYDKKNAGKSDDILNALACTEDREQLKKYLEWSVDTEKIAVEDSLTVFKSVGTNVKGYPLMYAFLYDKADDILVMHKENLSKVYSYWKFLYEITLNQKDFKKLEAFTNTVTSLIPNILTHLEESRKKAKKNIWWLKNKGESISSFFMLWSALDDGES